MPRRDVVQSTFDEAGKAAGFQKRSGTWRKVQAETIAVINLQKSNHSSRYFVNVALWLRALGDDEAPAEPHCHVRTRLSEPSPNPLDLDGTPMADSDRARALRDLLDAVLSTLEACSTVDGTREVLEAGLLGSVLIQRDAQALLTD